VCILILSVQNLQHFFSSLKKIDYFCLYNFLDMENNQAKLILALGKRLKAEKKVKAEVITSFKSAGILDKNTHISKNYSTIRKAIKLSAAK
jgi:hypothetical protein